MLQQMLLIPDEHMQNFLKKLFLVSVIGFSLCGFPLAVSATDLPPTSGVSGSVTEEIRALRNDLGTASGYQAATATSLSTRVGSVIRASLALVGTIFLILIVVGGFKIMTSGGEEEKFKDGMQMIRMGVIGLLIVLSAYAITRFVIAGLTK